MSAHKRGVTIYINTLERAGQGGHSDRRLFFSFSSLFVVFPFSSRSSYLVYHDFTVNTTSAGLRFLHNDLIIILIASRGNHNTIFSSL